MLLDNDCVTDVISKYSDHESVRYILDNLSSDVKFTFSTIEKDVIFKKLNDIDCKKATGWDNIPPKLLKFGAEVLCDPICDLMNQSILLSKFPSNLKKGEIIPLFKKGSILEKKNYRPISILPTLSKIFESVLIDQLQCFFEKIFSPSLSGYRKGHSCQGVLLNFVENCKKYVDNEYVYGLISADLSKAFDSLPYGLLLSKLSAYGLSENACTLVGHYFKSRQQRVKIGTSKSNWMNLTKGAPQGSLFGPFMFNVFQNDLICKLQQLCHVYNYADDTGIGCYAKSIVELHVKLRNAIDIMLHWYDDNSLQANASKFQFITFSRNREKMSITLTDDVILETQSHIKLLGIHIDDQLNFHEHATYLCKKSGRQLNALARMSRFSPAEVKMIVFQAFVLCNFSYCPVIWHFCLLSDMKKFEKLQYRGLKYVYNDFESSYTMLRQQGKRSLLYVDRIREIMIQLYKICCSESPMYLQDLINFKNAGYNLRNARVLMQPQVNTSKFGLNSFRYESVKMWNNLEVDIKCAANLKVFKSLIGIWEPKLCSCTCCIPCKLQSL